MIAGWRAVGSDIALGFYFTFLAECELLDGKPDAALEATSEALKWTEQNAEGQSASIAHIRRGDAFCLLQDIQSGETEYELALDIARRQDAKFWELRASTRLSASWQRRGRHNDAHDLLAPIYGWFTEGFDTLDLKEAKALLDALAK